MCYSGLFALSRRLAMTTLMIEVAKYHEETLNVIC